jgi:Flp pilus assembly protein TadG
MIEAAIMLPLFLIITFGVMEFGNMYMNRYQVHDVAGAVADYLQANPGATMDTPNGGLTTFVENLGVGLKNTTSGGENQISSKIKIKSATSIMTEAQFNALCSGGDVQSWGNPYLADADTTNDKNPYYIHVCYPYTYNNITPLSGLSVGALPATKTLKGKAIAYANTNNGGGGGDNPNPPMVNVKCPAGQFMVGISNTSPLCESVVAGNGGGGECSRIPGARLSDGSVVADRCSPMVTTAESYVMGIVPGFQPSYYDQPQSVGYLIGQAYHPQWGTVSGLEQVISENWFTLTRDMTIVPGFHDPLGLNNKDLEVSPALVGLTVSDGPFSVDKNVIDAQFSSPGKFCENLTAHGHSDWVLPTVAELYIMYNNRNAIGAMSPPRASNIDSPFARSGTALFFADSRNNSAKAERAADALISFGSTIFPVLDANTQLANEQFIKGGQTILRPNTDADYYSDNFWMNNLNAIRGKPTVTPMDNFRGTIRNDSFSPTGYFGVRCVRQSDQ